MTAATDSHSRRRNIGNCPIQSAAIYHGPSVREKVGCVHWQNCIGCQQIFFLPQFNQIAGVFMAKRSGRYYPLFEEAGTEVRECFIHVGSPFIQFVSREIWANANILHWRKRERSHLPNHRRRAVDRWICFLGPYTASNYFSCNEHNSHHLLDSSVVPTYLPPQRTEPTYLWTVIGKLYTARQSDQTAYHQWQHKKGSRLPDWSDREWSSIIRFPIRRKNYLCA